MKYTDAHKYLNCSIDTLMDSQNGSEIKESLRRFWPFRISYVSKNLDYGIIVYSNNIIKGAVFKMSISQEDIMVELGPPNRRVSFTRITDDLLMYYWIKEDYKTGYEDQSKVLFVMPYDYEDYLVQ